MLPDSLSLNRPLRNIGILLAGNGLRLGLGFLASVLTYRALSPADAGRFTLILSLVGLFSLFAEFGFRDAAVNFVASASTLREAQAVARAFLAGKMIFGTLAAGLLAVLAGWILNRWYASANAVSPALVRFAALGLLTGGLLNYIQTLLEARQTFGALSLISTMQAILRAAAIAILFLMGRVVLWPLLALEVSIPIVLLFYGGRFLPKEFRLSSFKPPLFRDVGRLWRFSRWIAVAAVASTIFLGLDVILLGHFRPLAEVGLYGVALAFLSKFEVIQNAILTASFPEACRYTTRVELHAYIFRTLRLTGLVSVGLLFIAPFARPLVTLLYGASYAGSALPFMLLFVGLIVGLNFQPVAFVLYPLGKPKWIAVGDVLQLGLTVALGLWLIPLYGATGAALTVLSTRLLGGGLTAAFVARSLR